MSEIQNANAEFNPQNLLHERTVIMDDAYEEYPAGDIGIDQTERIASKVIGELQLPDTDYAHIAILKVTDNYRGVSAYMLQGLELDEQGKKQCNEQQALVIEDHTEVLVGRYADTEKWLQNDNRRLASSAKLFGREAYGEGVSRLQVLLQVVDGNLTIQDASKNGTGISGHFKSTEPAPTHVANYTGVSMAVAANKELIDRQGVFADRTVIKRDTFPIDGGVDIRSWGVGAESLVVDSQDESYREEYDKLRGEVERVIGMYEEHHGPMNEKQVLFTMYDAVGRAMQYDLAHVDALTAQAKQSGDPHRMINVGQYLRDGKGVCRQMALVTSWLGGEMVQAGRLRGRMTTEANYRKSDNGAHEWARYTDADGKVTIVDPAYQYFGSLEGSIAQSGWEYYRPGEERVYQLGRQAGRSVLGKHRAPDPEPEKPPEADI